MDHAAGWTGSNIFCSSKACPSRGPIFFSTSCTGYWRGNNSYPSGAFNSFLPQLKLLPVKGTCQGQASQRTPLQLTVSRGAHPSSFSPPAYQQRSYLLQASGTNRLEQLKTDVCADDCSSLTSITLLQPPNGASVLTSPINYQGPNHLTWPCTVALPGLPAPNAATSPFLNCSLLMAFRTPVSLLLESVPSQSLFLAPTACGPACLHPHSL